MSILLDRAAANGPRHWKRIIVISSFWSGGLRVLLVPDWATKWETDQALAAGTTYRWCGETASITCELLGIHGDESINYDGAGAFVNMEIWTAGEKATQHDVADLIGRAFENGDRVAFVEATQ